MRCPFFQRRSAARQKDFWDFFELSFYTHHLFLILSLFSHTHTHILLFTHTCFLSLSLHTRTHAHTHTLSLSPPPSISHPLSHSRKNGEDQKKLFSNKAKVCKLQKWQIIFLRSVKKTKIRFSAFQSHLLFLLFAKWFKTNFSIWLFLSKNFYHIFQVGLMSRDLKLLWLNFNNFEFDLILYWQKPYFT